MKRMGRWMALALVCAVVAAAPWAMKTAAVDVRDIIRAIADNGDVMELGEGFAASMVTDPKTSTVADKVGFALFPNKAGVENHGN